MNILLFLIPFVCISLFLGYLLSIQKKEIARLRLKNTELSRTNGQLCAQQVKKNGKIFILFRLNEEVLRNFAVFLAVSPNGELLPPDKAEDRILMDIRTISNDVQEKSCVNYELEMTMPCAPRCRIIKNDDSRVWVQVLGKVFVSSILSSP